MKQITVVSGKGGTGKTTLTAFWSTLLDSGVVVDADVDAPNMHLVLRATKCETHRYVGKDAAVIDEQPCTECGVCADVCRFDAITVVDNHHVIDALGCEGCTLCALACPEHAIRMVPHESGEWMLSDTPRGALVHARLNIGEGNSGKLVTVVRQAAENLAEDLELETVLIDGPPGIGCQTIASLTGVDLAVVVTEPSAAGRHDMVRVLQVIERLGVPTVVILNKVDLAPHMEREIAAAAEEHGARMIGTVPFMSEVPRALAVGTLLSSPPPGLPAIMTQLWARVVSAAEEAHAEAR